MMSNFGIKLQGHVTLVPQQAPCYTKRLRTVAETGRGVHCCIGFKSSETLKGASVFDLISSTVTPSAYSTNVSPVVKSTSNTACLSISLSIAYFMEDILSPPNQ